MGKPFQNVHICAAGRFDSGIGEKIPQWVRANRGEYSNEVHKQVTHLIATKEAFQKNVEAGLQLTFLSISIYFTFRMLMCSMQTVQQAKKLRTVKIVSYDWLAESLLSKTHRPKKENPYLLEDLRRKTEKRRTKLTRKFRERENRRLERSALVWVCFFNYCLVELLIFSERA